MPASPPKTEVLTPSRLKERRRRVRLYRTVALIILVLILSGSAIGFFYIRALRIREVSVQGAETVRGQKVEELLRNELSGRKAFLFPKDNAFIYDEPSLREAVLHAFPKIQSIEFKLANFHRIEVTMQERSPAGLWCGESKQNAVPCSYFDADGVVYEGAPEYSGNAYIQWYGKVIGEPLGGKYLGGQFSALAALIKEFEKEGIQTKTVSVTNTGDVEADYAGDFRLMFTANQKPESVLEALHAAKGSAVLKDKSLSDLQYLDLRFLGNRLYYKLK